MNWTDRLEFIEMSKLSSEIRAACQWNMRSVLKCCKLTFIFVLSVEDLVFALQITRRFMFGSRNVANFCSKWKVKPQMLFLLWYLRDGTPLTAKASADSFLCIDEHELRSFRLRVVSPTVCSPTSRVDSPTSRISIRSVKLRAMTINV